jgi:hypothetical protein
VEFDCEDDGGLQMSFLVVRTFKNPVCLVER